MHQKGASGRRCPDRPGTEFCVDIVVKGRKTEVPERFRRHVAEKLKVDKIQRIDGKITRLDVEVSKEHNPRQADRSDRVEITLRHRGPVVRAEAAAADPYGALDLAVEKLESRLRRQHDKRRCRRGRDRTPASEVAAVVPDAAQLNGQGELLPPEPEEPRPPVRRQGSVVVEGDGPLVVREKTHRAAPMSLAQALYEMELVGHDFYLFVDSDSKQPSVVYRRHAYDYGVIHLETDPLAEVAPEEAGGALGG
ncbi:ribosome-associated translation inhibitor RaiA [Streptomyces marincola]|nr:ribosome-associated translation inhibitor RaiA [Streptomyces marincola]UCM88375.1 ribosome-associated translation inhibitor RaiA [Streptomyces marincola]